MFLKYVKEIPERLKLIEKEYKELRKYLEELTKNQLKLNERVDEHFKTLKHMQRKLIPYVYNDIYEQFRKNSKIRETFITELFKGIENVKVPVGVINEKSRHDNHVNLLYVVAIAMYLKSKNIFEFGTWLGRTTYHLTFASDDTLVTTLDLPPEKSAASTYLGHFFKGSDREHRIKQILCDSMELNTLPFQKKMDLIFIDGNHSFEGVANDTKKAFEMLAPRGVIVWDDYEPKNPDVVKFFSEFTQKCPVFHIKKTCLLIYIDGVDVFSFEPYKGRFSIDPNVLKKGD